MPHLEPAGNSELLVPGDDPRSTSPDSDAGTTPGNDVVIQHWVSDAEWGDIEEIVVYGDAA